MAKANLENIAPDIQILICTFLHPTDILVLRKTCRSLQDATRQRVVWIAALHRICIDNTLFLPTFPIHDMSNEELEHAAMAPTQWSELSKKLRLGDEENPLSSGKIRVIEKNQPHSFFSLVPGGRYLIIFTPNGVALWDLGYNSCSDVACLASVASVDDDPLYKPFESYIHATSDGKGLVLLTTLTNGSIRVFDIYPQIKEPQFNQIAYLDAIDDVDSWPYCISISHDNCIMLCNANHDGFGSSHTTFFRVWDYKENLSKSWSFDVDFIPHEPIVTKTSVFLVCGKEILIWHVFPLTHHGPPPPASQNNNIPRLSPNIRVKIPDEYTYGGEVLQLILPRWYLGSSQPLYIDLWTDDLDPQVSRLKLEINPESNNATLHLINTFQVDIHCHGVEFFTICGDTVVYSLNLSTYYYGGIPSGPMIPAANGYQSAMDIMKPMPGQTALCPASGRLVYFTINRYSELTIHDLLPHRSSVPFGR